MTFPFGAGEFPLARGLYGQARKIFAGAGVFKFGIRDVPGGVHVQFHTHAHRTLDGGQRFLRNLRKNLIENLSAPFDFASGFWRGDGSGFRDCR